LRNLDDLPVFSRSGVFSVHEADFEDLWPFSSDEFFSTYWSQKPCLVRGNECDFRALMPWDSLNQALYSRKLEDLRLRLVRSGDVADQAEYTDRHQTRKGAPRTRVDPAKLSELLRDGFTLVIDEVD